MKHRILTEQGPWLLGVLVVGWAHWRETEVEFALDESRLTLGGSR